MGAWQELVDYVVPSNTTSVTLNNFGTITKDDFIKFNYTHVGRSGFGVSISIFPNNNTTISNYYAQILTGDGSSVGAFRTNNNFIGFTESSMVVYGYAKLSENNKFNFFANTNRNLDSSLFLRNIYGTSISDFVNGITSLTFTANVTNGLGANSRIQIYKLAAEKVADITVTSNTTQVDITGLDIKKGDEYLLVAQRVVDTAPTQNADTLLFVNNNTTTTNYYAQQIQGNGSSASAERVNRPRVLRADAGSHMAYIHIKVSEIGAFTFQAYQINNLGSSNILLWNTFCSSTFENITSINQLNYVSPEANKISAGSRLELYKLYEGGN